MFVYMNRRNERVPQEGTQHTKLRCFLNLSGNISLLTCLNDSLIMSAFFDTSYLFLLSSPLHLFQAPESYQFVCVPITTVNIQ